MSDSANCSCFYDAAHGALMVIDQTLLPHETVWRPLQSLEEFCAAIADMQVRGAPLIGVTAAYGLALALGRDSSARSEQRATEALLATRPTAVNLAWALARVRRQLGNSQGSERGLLALECAHALRSADIETCSAIGEHGLSLLQKLAADRSKVLNIMTHCNAGWLATVRWGTALAPIYKALAAGLDVHVWVSETRPRNQGLNLTAWELAAAGVAYTVIADNAAGHLMQRGEVDCCIVGSDRTAANGDVCNKIGTYLKALAASSHSIPFYVALPLSTIDWQCASGAAIPIETRGPQELLEHRGLDGSGALRQVRTGAAGVNAYNPAFDVTPAALVTALITEHGLVSASAAALQELRSKVPADAAAAAATG